jgi:hypothetical protein
MPDVYSIAEAAGRLDELVRRAAAGEEIILEGSGDKRARLTEDGAVGFTSADDAPRVPAGCAPAKGVRLGLCRGEIWVSDDFDETPEWLLDAFEGVGADSPFPDGGAQNSGTVRQGSSG